MARRCDERGYGRFVDCGPVVIPKERPRSYRGRIVSPPETDRFGRAGRVTTAPRPRLPRMAVRADTFVFRHFNDGDNTLRAVSDVELAE